MSKDKKEKKVIKPKITNEIQTLIDVLSSCEYSGEYFSIPFSVKDSSEKQNTLGLCGMCYFTFDFDKANHIIKSMKTYQLIVDPNTNGDIGKEFWFPTTIKTKKFDIVSHDEAKRVRMDFLEKYLVYLNTEDDEGDLSN